MSLRERGSRMYGRLAWNYELTHPLMPRFFRDIDSTLRWYGISIGKFGIGVIRRRRLKPEER